MCLSLRRTWIISTSNTTGMWKKIFKLRFQHKKSNLAAPKWDPTKLITPRFIIKCTGGAAVGRAYLSLSAMAATREQPSSRLNLQLSKRWSRWTYVDASWLNQSHFAMGNPANQNDKIQSYLSPTIHIIYSFWPFLIAAKHIAAYMPILYIFITALDNLWMHFHVQAAIRAEL